MKILFVSSSSGSRGGGELYLLYLGKALAARGHELTLWASDHERMDELCAQFSAIGPVIRAPYQNTYDHRARSLATCLNTGTARRIAASWSGFDLVHLNKQNLEDGLDLLRALNLQPGPALCTIHLTQSARFLGAKTAWLRDLIACRALNRSRHPFVAISRERTRDLANFLGRTGGVHQIANGVPLLPPTTGTASGAGSLHIMAVGRLMPQKRPLHFLELAHRIHRMLPAARFTWVGDGALPGARFASVDDDAMAHAWAARVSELGLDSVVTRTGWRADVPELLGSADAFLHTAEYEGLPLALLEAMSAALPCAVTPRLLADLPFLKAGENCLCADDSDDWILQLSDPATRQRLGAAARGLIATTFSHERMAAEYEALYRSLCAFR